MFTNFQEKYRNIYKKFKPIFCPVFDEMVYFNSKGLNHLFYKKHRPRIQKDINRRLALLPYVDQVISAPMKFYSGKDLQNSIAENWVLESTIVKDNGLKSTIKVVVIRKKPHTRLYFLSVMDQSN